MARPRRITQTASILDRTVERVAIAALAAVAARGSGESLAFSVVTIFIIVVAIEEFGRLWVWQGKRVTLRTVAFASIGDLRLQRAEARRGGRKRKRRTRAQRRRNNSAARSADQGGSHVQG